MNGRPSIQNKEHDPILRKQGFICNNVQFCKEQRMTVSTFIPGCFLIFVTFWLGLDYRWFEALFLSPFFTWGAFYLFYLFFPKEENCINRVGKKEYEI